MILEVKDEQLVDFVREQFQVEQTQVEVHWVEIETNPLLESWFHQRPYVY